MDSESEIKPKTVHNFVKIRENLQKYYEVVDHEKSTLKCRLAGKNDCKVNGKAAVFTYSPRRGWNNFERHLKRVHKFSAEEFIHGKRQRLLQTKRQQLNTFNVIADEGGESAKNGGSSSKSENYVETQWTTSIAKEKYCVVCRDECTNDLDDQNGMITSTDELDLEQLKSLFPGGGQCNKLCHQLYFIFFLRKIVDFPSKRCEVFLKKCRGLRTPETWFFLCSDCRRMTLQAAEIHEKLMKLQRDMENIKQLIIAKYHKDAARSFSVPLSPIEEEIRIYLKDSPATGKSGTALQDQSVDDNSLDVLDMENLHDDEWTTQEEVERKCETGFKDVFFSLRSSKCSKGSKKREGNATSIDEELLEDNDERTRRKSTKADLSIVKVEPEDDQPEVDNDNDDQIACHSDSNDREFEMRESEAEMGSETEEESAVDNPIRIRENLRKYFKVINHKRFTIKCRLAGKDDCKMDGVSRKLKYSPQCGWYNFERHLIRVHKLSQVDIILGKGLNALDRVSNTDTSNHSHSKSKQKFNKSLKRAKKTASKKSSIKTKRRYQPLERDQGERNDNGEIKSVKFYVCQLCPTKYKCSGSLREHLEAHEISKTMNNKYDCKKCGYPCHSEFKNKKHFSIKHASEGGVPCSLCDYSSPTQRQMSAHLQEHKDEAEKERVGGKYLCKLCNRLFVAYEILCKHKRTEHYKELGVTPLRCDECSLIFSTKRLLRDHVQQTHKKESRFFCDICGRGMMYMSKLRRHMNGHMKDRCFVCEICGADFQYDETLRLHIKKDHPDMEAGAGTSKTNSLANTSSEFTCKHCNEVFSSLTLLFRHTKTHTELYANKCKLCGKGYVTPQSLRRHMEINHSTNEVPCKFCGKIFPHHEYIRMHYRFCKNYPGERRRVKATDGEPLENFIVDDQNPIDEDVLRSMMVSSEHSIELSRTVSVSGNISGIQNTTQQGDVEVKIDQNEASQNSPEEPSLVPVTPVINMVFSGMTQSVLADSE